MSLIKLVAVIPVRKGSQRVKNKNLRKFSDTNLLTFKIETLKKVKRIDKIIINTDSDEAIEIAKKHNVEYKKREKYYASSECSNSEFWSHIAKQTKSDFILFTNCTSPLIKVETYNEIIDNLDESAQSNLPPSERQVAAIIRLLDRLKLDYEDFLDGFGAKEISDLTGGRNGSASDAIGKLIELDKNSPATEKQVSTIISMTDSLSMPIEQAMEAVQTESISTITKSDASMLISNLKKTINTNRRKKK